MLTKNPVEAWAEQDAAGLRIGEAYRLIAEAAQAGFAVLDDKGTVLFANRRLGQILSLPPGRMAGISVKSLLSGPEGDVLSELLAGGQEDFRTECHLKTGSGFRSPVNVAASRLLQSEKRFTCIVVTDLSSQKRDHSLSELIMELAADAMIVCDSSCRIAAANPAAVMLLGNNLEGRDFHVAVPLENLENGRCIRLPAVDGMPLKRQKVYFRNGNGDDVYLLLSADRLGGEGELEPRGYVVLLSDVSELCQFARQMMRLDRLNIIGEMAAGIGHEVRNPLTTVRGYLQRYCQTAALEKYRESFQLMIEELDRANTIISDFLSLARDKPANLVVTDLNKVIENLFPLLQADAFLRNCNLELELGDIPQVLADEKEIRQCLLNLVGNGLDAMPSGGRVTVSTVSEGDRVYLTVRDEGPGLPPEVREKLGTPFFTTKEHGTGLGLAVCYRIAQRHRAVIEVDTGTTGTAFHFVFGT